MTRLILPVLGLLFSSSQSLAAVVTLMATDVGTYSPSSFFTNSYEVAEFDGLPDFGFRNFAIFDLSSITRPIVSAQLLTDTGGDTARFNDVIISMRAYTASIAALSDGTASYAALASGDEYGSISVLASAPDDSPLTIDLNPTAITDLNAATGLFAIAGSQPTPTLTAGVFGDVTESRVSLVVTTTAIPEPGAGVFFLGAGIACLFRGRRRAV